MLKTTEFKIKQTAIPGLLEIDITAIEDERGYFQEKFQKEKLVVSGFPAGFEPIQHNIAFSKETGVTRGLHAEPWDKYITVIAGKVYAVFVDLRAGDNFGTKVAIEMNEQKSVFVPRGVANSYQTLTDNVYYSYLVNDHWSPDKNYQAVNLADPELNIQWPIGLDKATISDKDRKNPMLKDLK
ncbi:MAG: dTDP-4-dehydrorhamnose 3,5-epimerase [Candidatus Doudnabacteria bacterium RIFCSPLOWO2_02_FULL_49_13]|uniref:dTDP-4-dehydrorhamnose 3,5-epimerase n=1 Tax=Candidatus Doudnabacteria bacterium RIFCSPHIGHO2_12_FULL_48_16 TaxID=1817838 RepID=A0A1F5PL78_9BACT|nr:MAG: dTDP-4-dehydrorhamnose 3,5-epimerase [Candidatus Doudnabacteria bacterium RIFCSPHIGHO2_02_FULL_49_24]OGE88851.1 MAG: dTDP-4-dehydrorhamnose 3,5-epimerase [Candidatus Doudnabacteria bacterium RIFCSPHIGHO2_01_FULL_50_67]OGE90629.1 MAG: dTDP-4-dehydrorhamnose 3,5-epimerase [Candidatus Doudnabacteria bacterium RIFCSPHIGHO2_12_FULL_48_16]OGE96960.1 MAG: dTDP-4-dehydrorhamnose 3,5-epimerase [Candidatus Doudnabacteria bacterium RIFCSPLOWO2_01_FULL_49_40]OGF02494.1 MAG: dTDP-4-dehydrorhamnose 3